MSKRSIFTNISPLPPGVSREVAIEFLHDHLEMIDLNPLIKERHMIEPPDHATPEEMRCIWYSLTDKISYLPGGVMSGDVTYTCAFHNLPVGLQTHCYAPMGLVIRDKWSVAGSLPGEAPEPVELGLGAPASGLYIREDVEMRCNIIMSSFVKKTLQKAHSVLVDRLAQKATAISSHRSTPQPSAPGTPISRPSLQSQSQHSSWQSSSHSRHPSSSSNSFHGAAPPPSSVNHPYPQQQYQQQYPQQQHQPQHQHQHQHQHQQQYQHQHQHQGQHSQPAPPMNHQGGPGNHHQAPWPQQAPALQPPPQPESSWGGSDVLNRTGTLYNGPSKPQHYAQIAGLNPYDDDHKPPPMPPMPSQQQQHPAQSYQPYQPFSELDSSAASRPPSHQPQRPLPSELE